MIRSKTVLAVVSLALAGVALAQNKDQTSWVEKFRKADADKSGGLSKAELAKTAPNEFRFIKRNFDQLDTNKDGQVTVAERDAGLKAVRERQAKNAAAKK